MVRVPSVSSINNASAVDGGADAVGVVERSEDAAFSEESVNSVLVHRNPGEPPTAGCTAVFHAARVVLERGDASAAAHHAVHGVRLVTLVIAAEDSAVGKNPLWHRVGMVRLLHSAEGARGRK